MPVHEAQYFCLPRDFCPPAICASTRHLSEAKYGHYVEDIEAPMYCCSLPPSADSNLEAISGSVHGLDEAGSLQSLDILL
jgi:hypothetical protein